MNTNDKTPGLIAGIVILVALAAGATALLSLTDSATEAQRRENQAVHAARLLREVIPAGEYDPQPGLLSITLEDAELLGTAEPVPAYPVYRNGEAAGVVLTVIAPDGYVAPLTLLVGIDTAGTISGVRVTGHRETPGLGDKVEPAKSDWITTFTGRSFATTPRADWSLARDGGDYDHISGATITSRAVVTATANALDYFSANRSLLLGPPPAPAGELAD